MSPEFSAVLEEREQLRYWIIVLPICLGFLALIVAAVKSRKSTAFLYITALAIASVAMPTLMCALWWGELTDVVTSHEDRNWIHNHDGGGLLIAPLYTTILATVFWIIAILVLSVRVAIGLIRKTRERREQYIDARESS